MAPVLGFAEGERKADRLAPHATVLGVSLSEDTFDVAFRILGPTELKDNRGDAAAQATAACYVGADGTALALLSSGELGGGWLTSFELATAVALVDFSGDIGGSFTVPEHNKPRCKSLGRLSKKTTSGGGLGLGATRHNVIRLLGKPCDHANDVYRFCSVEKRHSTPGQIERFRQRFGEGEYEVFEVHRWIVVRFSKGVAVSIRVEQTYT